MTTRRPVTHPATQDIQRHLNQVRDAYVDAEPVSTPLDVPRAPLPASGAVSAPSAHPEAFCDRCGARNCTWFASNGDWNAVTAKWVDADVCCPSCFVGMHEAQTGELHAWRLIKERDVDRLTRERDDLLAMRARVEARHVTCRDHPTCDAPDDFCHECGCGWPCLTVKAIRGGS